MPHGNSRIKSTLCVHWKMIPFMRNHYMQSMSFLLLEKSLHKIVVFLLSLFFLYWLCLTFLMFQISIQNHFPRSMWNVFALFALQYFDMVWRSTWFKYKTSVKENNAYESMWACSILGRILIKMPQILYARQLHFNWYFNFSLHHMSVYQRWGNHFPVEFSLSSV